MGKQKGYVNGSDLLLFIEVAPASGTDPAVEKAIGHCTSHTATFNTETKDVAVKPVSSEAQGNTSLYKNKRVSGLSAQVKCDGLHFYGETEGGLKILMGKWAAGEPVKLKLYERKTTTSQDAPEPYCQGMFIISSLENNAPAGEDATYTATFDNDGAVDIDTDNLDHDTE